MHKNRFLILMAALLMVFLSGTVTNAMPSTQTNEVVFKTPEDAITAYIEGVTEGDLQKILQACAINEVSENFKFDLYIDRIKALTPYISPAPSEYPLYVDLNKTQLSGQIAGQAKIFAYSLLSTEDMRAGTTILMDSEKAANFVKAVDPKRLAGIEVQKIVLPNKTVMISARYVDNSTKLAKVYGADESTERVVLFSFEQNYYYIGLTILRYGENWKIYSQNSPLVNTPALGTATQTTVAEFDKSFDSK